MKFTGFFKVIMFLVYCSCFIRFNKILHFTFQFLFNFSYIPHLPLPVYFSPVFLPVRPPPPFLSCFHTPPHPFTTPLLASLTQPPSPFNAVTTMGVYLLVGRLWGRRFVINTPHIYPLPLHSLPLLILTPHLSLNTPSVY